MIKIERWEKDEKDNSNCCINNNYNYYNTDNIINNGK